MHQKDQAAREFSKLQAIARSAKMSAAQLLNPKAESRVETPTTLWEAQANNRQRRGEALKVNISAGEGLQDVLKSNLGPSGTIKMYSISSKRHHVFSNDLLGWSMELVQYVECS